MKEMAMRHIIKKEVHRKLLGECASLAQELRRRRRMRFGKALDLLEKMQGRMIERGSWERV